MMVLLGELQQGLKTLNLEISSEQQQKLLDYLALLVKWNSAYNLTAVRDPNEMISRHLLDSLSIAPWVLPINGEFLDVGSGGGLPGVPLAIVFPDKNWTLVDSIGKKVRFLTQVKLQLGLNNLQAVQTRIEQFQPATAFNGIVSRAFSEVTDFAEKTRHLGDRETHWLAMKGGVQRQELQQLPKDFHCAANQRLKVPGCQGERHLLILRRTT